MKINANDSYLNEPTQKRTLKLQHQINYFVLKQERIILAHIKISKKLTNHSRKKNLGNIIAEVLNDLKIAENFKNVR